jgi:hypothetical protein
VVARVEEFDSDRVSKTKPNMKTLTALTFALALTAQCQSFVNGSFESFSPYTGNDGVNWGPRLGPSDSVWSWANVPAGSPVLTGWTIQAGNVDLTSAPWWPQYDGLKALDLTGTVPGTISQTVTFTEERTGHIEFALRFYNPGAPQIGVEILGPGDEAPTTIGVFTASTFNWSINVTSDIEFGVGDYTFGFYSLESFRLGPLIDDIRLELDEVVPDPDPEPEPDPEPVIPEPSTYALLSALGLAAFAGYRRLA